MHENKERFRLRLIQTMSLADLLNNAIRHMGVRTPEQY